MAKDAPTLGAGQAEALIAAIDEDLPILEAVVVILAGGHHVTEGLLAADLHGDLPAGLVQEDPLSLDRCHAAGTEGLIGLGVHRDGLPVSVEAEAPGPSTGGGVDPADLVGARDVTGPDRRNPIVNPTAEPGHSRHQPERPRSARRAGSQARVNTAS